MIFLLLAVGFINKQSTRLNQHTLKNLRTNSIVQLKSKICSGPVWELWPKSTDMIFFLLVLSLRVKPEVGLTHYKGTCILRSYYFKVVNNRLEVDLFCCKNN